MRWQKAFRIFWGQERWLTFVGNQLGQLDVELINEEDSLVRNAQPIPGGGRQIQFGRELTLSYLWVLGAYEFVRVLSQRQNKGNIPFFREKLPKVHELKRRFARVRMPLAKLEAANDYKSDFPEAFPYFDIKRKSIGWKIAKGVMITRRELSDELLVFLEQVKP